MKHTGNLEIRTEADAKKYAGLTEVTGYLYVDGSAKLEAPTLKSVGGYPASVSVDGDFHVIAATRSMLPSAMPSADTH